MRLVNESLEDILKPKSKEDIAKDFSDKILSALKEEKAVSFYKEWSTASHKFNVFFSTYNISMSFQKYIDEYGKGLYIMTSIKTPNNVIPLQNLFPYQKLYSNSIIKYDIKPTEIEKAVQELVKEAYLEEKIGNGFHLRWAWSNEKQIHESVIFKPKEKDEILDNIADTILHNYTAHSMYYSSKPMRYGEIPLSHHTGTGFMNHLNKKYGEGTFIHVDDESESFLIEYLISNNIKYNKIGKSTVKIKNLNILMSKNLIQYFCENINKGNIKNFMIRKYEKT